MNVSAKVINARMKERARRNPILAEKTPRVEQYKNWDFAVPSARPPIDRWNYPKEPISLLAKFNSQKEKIAKEDEVMKQYYQRLASFEVKDKVRRQLEQEAEEHKRRLREIAEQEEELLRQASNEHTSRTTARTTHRSTARSLPEPSPRLTSVPIGHITDLHDTHPEILDQWRAQRAAEYIAQHQLTPTAHNLSHSKLQQPGMQTFDSFCCNVVGFRPAGSTQIYKKNAMSKSSASKQKPLPLSPTSIQVRLQYTFLYNKSFRKIMEL